MTGISTCKFLEFRQAICSAHIINSRLVVNKEGERVLVVNKEGERVLVVNKEGDKVLVVVVVVNGERVLVVNKE
jgi:DNA-binding beta-propeller fold protein YncE